MRLNNLNKIARLNRKGALELSIQAIVIIVIAMTLLGLGLAFVRGLFGDITGISESTFQRISEQLSTDLATSDANLIFSKSTITIERGGNSVEGFGVRNDENQAIKYGLQIETFNCPDEARQTEGDKTTPCINVKDWFEYFKSDQQYEVKAAERQVNRIQINVPRSAKTGLYLLKISAYLGIWSAEPALECTGDYDPVGKPDGCTKLGQTELFLTVA